MRFMRKMADRISMDRFALRQPPKLGVERLAFSVEETATCLGVSRATCWRLIAQGHLNPRKVGRRTLILRSDLVAFLEALPT